MLTNYGIMFVFIDPLALLKVAQLKAELKIRIAHLNGPIKSAKKDLVAQLKDVLVRGTCLFRGGKKQWRVVCKSDEFKVPIEGPPPLDRHSIVQEKKVKSVKERTHTQSQVETLGFNCIRQAHSKNFSAEIRSFEHMLYPGGSVKAYLEILAEGKNPCRQLNTITRRSITKSGASPLPRLAFVNADHQLPEEFIGKGDIEHTGEPVFWVPTDRPRSIRACGALEQLEASYGGEQNQEKSTTIADLIAIVAHKNGVDIADQSFLESIILDKSKHDRLSSALKIHKEACQSRKKQAASTRPKVRSALDFFKESTLYDPSDDASPPSDQLNALEFKDRRPFQSLAALARYERHVQNIEEALI